MDTMNYDEESHPVRRVLKSLPEVPASEGFELRLKRRISQEALGARDKPEGKKFFGFRAPSYALSLTVIVAVGLVAYYALLRRGLTPPGGATGSGEPKPEMQTGRHDTALLPTVSPLATSRPPSSGKESSAVSVPGDSKTDYTLSRSQEAAQEELLKRGSLQQVGGTPRTQSSQPFGMPGSPAQQQTRRIGMEKDPDSAARARDLLKKDSLGRSGKAQMGIKKK